MNNFNLNFENKRGIEQEINYLGSINDRVYMEEVEKALVDSLSIEYLRRNKSCKSPVSFLEWIKEEKPEMFNRLKSEVKNDVDRIMENKVKKIDICF